ncbi:MAG TPA: DJ-1/PfpI family protein [Candidatus Syntrophoarchaeum butanivorans]|uniref:4-methyl-5(B-hydroxyethyl)-thiazole monophosphate biosynthesis protein n=1 Tax=Candidatus Syntropharchaeum butanivorans TaxID=1839936 RepID=A0A1F2P5D9_9EURY|nr:MAG: 4-methyl-5(B-hydroxyethyl)-thiazole monophosphate biosynthesis protein [Candidatus Syntrophoarchaeum butanivorans]HEC56318.1 DJ-1/PfpI family protein [Candidatus Syntrophoarchaeum butanivorans]
MKVLVPLAQGFEEIEAITLVDILRRGGLEVVTASLDGSDLVEAAHGVKLAPDTSLSKIDDPLGFDAIILPGGNPGYTNLRRNSGLLEVVRRMNEAGRIIAAICGAPTVLSDLGILRGRAATSHPSVKGEIVCGEYREDRTVVDGRIITSRSAGSAMEFAFKLLEVMKGHEIVEEVNRGVIARL